MTPSIEISSTSATPATIPCKPFFTAALPLPPGVNASYKIIKTPGGKLRFGDTDAARTFKDAAEYLLCMGEHDYALLNAIRLSHYKVPLAVDIRFFYTTLWKRDIDGGEKAVIDAVFKHLELNDNTIVEKHTTKSVDRNDPRVEVEVRCLLGVAR